MNKQNRYTEKLFSYGTLQYEAVQISTFGRKLNGVSDILSGYRLDTIKINDSSVVETSGTAVHPILRHTGNAQDEVMGIVFDITSKELQQADTYEVADYKRIHIKLHSGTQAWVYVSAKQVAP